MKRFCVPLLQSSVIVLASMLLTACPTAPVDGEGEGGSVVGEGDSASQGAGTFLENSNSRLNEWLDTPISVQWKYMRLPGLFDYSPVNKLNYEFEALPTTDEMFEFEDESVTPRELLGEVAAFYDLQMSVEPGNYVLVKGRE